MLELSINLIMYIAFSAFLIWKSKGISANAAIFLFYTLIALFGVLIYDTPFYNWGYYNHLTDHTRNTISFPPLLFIFISFIIYYWSISGINSLKITSIARLPRSIENALFIVSTLFLLYFLFLFRNMFFTTTTDFSDTYADGINLDVLGFIGKYVLTIESGLDIFFVIFPFYLFSKKQKKATKKGIIILILFILASYVKASIIASRGTIFFCFANLFFAFLMFRNMLTPKIVKIIKVGGLVTLGTFISLSIAISISRFGDLFFYSIASYFGEPFLNFPLIFWNYPKFMDGEYLAYQLLGGLPPKTPIWMGYFRTMPGSVYVDFGVAGSFLFFAIYAIVFKKIIGKVNTTITFSQMYIYAYIVFQMIYGVFGFNILPLKVFAISIILYILFRATQIKEQK